MLFGALIAVLTLATPAGPTPRLPPDFVFQEGKYSPGPVVFSHEYHYEKIGQCQVCHLGIFKVRQGEAVMTFKNITRGKFCGACHDGKTEFGGKIVFNAHEKHTCGRCHKE